MATRKSSSRKSSKVRARSPRNGAHKNSSKSAEQGKTVLYLYGITSGGKSGAEQELNAPSVEGANPVIALPCGEFLAWASNVSRVAFVDSLAANMQNLEWLANASVRHQGVLNELGKRGTVLPVRFGLVFSGQAALARDVASRRQELAQQFHKVAEADEWGVKVFRTRAQPAMLGEADSGADYLRRKAKVLQSETRERSASVPEEIRNFAGELKKIVRDVAAAGGVSSGQPGLEWQISVLLPRKQRSRFDQLIRRSAEAWNGIRRIEVTGPWPPYSFVKEGA